MATTNTETTGVTGNDSTAAAVTPLAHVVDSKQIDALKKAIANGGTADIRVVYSDYDAAAAAWEKASTLAASLGLAVVSMPDSINAAGPDGATIQINPFEGNRVAIAGLMERVTVEGKEKNAVVGLVRFPMPTVEAFAESASDWLEKIIEKEAAHVAFRRLRGSESLEELTANMAMVPTNAEDFAASYRAKGGVDTDAFDEMWPEFRQMLLAQYPALDGGVLPPKAEVIKCIRDAQYARETQELLESKQLFKFIATQMVALAPSWADKDGNENAIDASAISAWIESRDTPIYSIRTIDPDKLASLSFDIGV